MIGRTLSHFKVVGTLGKGGMGEVWVAEDAKLLLRVALKILSSEFADDPDRRERFEREARAVAALKSAEKAIEAQPWFVRSYQRLACCLGHMGHDEDTHDVVRKLLQRQPDFSLTYIDAADRNFELPVCAASGGA